MELPNKSDTGKPKKDVKPVIPGAAQASRPATKRFTQFLFAESPKALLGKVGRDVIVPRMKAGIEEAFNSFIHGMFWGQGSSPLQGLARGTVLRGGGTNYAAVSSGSSSALQQAQAATQQPSAGYQDIVCATQQHAELVLAGMYDLLNQYRVVAVGDYYELANMTPPPNGNNIGWFSLDGARIVKSREGYVIELPRPQRI